MSKNRNYLSDIMRAFARGSDLSSNWAQIVGMQVGLALFISGFIAFLVTFAYWYFTTPDMVRDIATKWLGAKIITGYLMQPTTWTIDMPGEIKNISGHALLASDQVARHVTAAQDSLLHSWRYGWPSGIVTALILIAVWTYHGVMVIRDMHLRGGKLVSENRLIEMVTSRDQDSDITIGNVPIVAESETEHTLISGAPGVGKSQLIMSQLDVIQERGDSAVIYDPSGDFIRYYYNPDRGDVLLNPLDARSIPWTPWQEISIAPDADRLAAALIPKDGMNEQYWVDAARVLLATGLNKLDGTNQRNIYGLLSLLLSSSMEGLRDLASGTDAEGIFAEGNDRMALSVRATMSAYVRSLRFLPARSYPDSEFSVTNWMSHADKANGRRPWLFLGTRADWHESLKPLLSAWIDSAAAAILSLPPRRERRVWFVLDEFPTLPPMDCVKALLAQGRKYGVAGVLGLQTVAQLRDVYGEDGAATITGLCSTRATFRLTDPDTADWASRALGAAEIDEKNEAESFSAEDTRESVNLGTQRNERRVVMPDEIMGLKKLSCYVRLPGDYPIAKTQVKFKPRTARAEAQVATDLSNSAYMAMLGDKGIKKPSDDFL